MSTDLSNLTSYISTEVESTIDDFIFIDKEGEEEPPSKHERISGCSPMYLFKILIIITPIGIMFKYLIEWNDILALWIEFALLLLQLILALDKIPALRLDTKAYLSGPKITGALEEIKTDVGEYWSKKSHYVVLYHTTNTDGRPISIRKTLQAGVLDGNLVNETKGDYNVLTDLVCKEGAPFSAFPRASIRKYQQRYRRWTLYMIPVLVVTCLAIICNLIYSFHWKKSHRNQRELIMSVFIVYGVLCMIVLPLLVCRIRRWHHDVNNGGHETNDVKALNHGV
jgi:hypothetical protein